MFTIEEFPGRRFASIEEANLATEERNKYIRLLKKLKKKVKFTIYHITKVTTNVKEKTAKEEEKI